MMRRLRTSAFILGLFTVLAAPAAAQSKARKLFDILDAVSDGKSTHQEGLAALAALGMPEDLAALARKGRPVSKGLRPGKKTIELEDGLGRKTELRLIIPKKGGKKGRGLLILLHGLGGEGSQLIPVYESFARKKGLIIAAPSAQKLPSVGQKGPSGARAEGNEDSSGFEILQHWWAYRDYGFPMRALAFLKRRIKIDLDRVYLSGYSMGGFGTWNIGLRFHDRFAALAPLAGSISRQENLAGVDVRSRGLLDNALHQPMYIIHGAKDLIVRPDADRRSRDALEAMKAPFVYAEDPNGRHILGQYFTQSKDRRKLTSWLGKQVRDPFPKRVQHRSLGAYMGRAYWAHILAKKGSTALVKAEVLKGNRIEISIEQVEKLRLELPPKLFDARQPIVVMEGDKERFNGLVAASHDAVLDSWLGREDPALVTSRDLIIESP